jgi:endo-1,3-1,4-beta-glycanase ExoK
MRKFMLLASCVLLVAVAMGAAKPQKQNNGRKKRPPTASTFTDNFANLNNWIVSDWGAPGGGQFKPDHVDISTGMLRLIVTQDGTTAGSIGGEVQSRQSFGYGRYDFVVRASSTSATPDGTGSSVSGQITGCFNFVNDSETEIDAPEIEGQNPLLLQFTNWRTTSENEHSVWPVSWPPEAGFHKYSFIWNVDRIDFLVDDMLVSTHTQYVPSAPAYIMFNHWGTNSTEWGGLATPEVTRYVYVKSVTFTANSNH